MSTTTGKAELTPAESLVLAACVRTRRRPGPTELNAMTGVPRSSCHVAMRRLESLGLLPEWPVTEVDPDEPDDAERRQIEARRERLRAKLARQQRRELVTWR